MGFKRPLVRFQSLGPKKSPVTARVTGLFFFFIHSTSHAKKRNKSGIKAE